MIGYEDLQIAERLARAIPDATTQACMLHLIHECRATRKADRALRAQLAAAVFRGHETLFVDKQLCYEAGVPGHPHGEASLADLAVRAADAILRRVDQEERTP